MHATHFIFIMLASSLCFIATACGETEETPLDCGRGAAMDVDGQTYCRYEQSITETGFDCPAAVPARYNFSGGVVCGPTAGLPDDVVEKIEKEAKMYWKDPSTDPVEVGTNPSFTTCDDVQKTEMYCAAERLVWAYDATAKTLKLDNTRAMLNCCGERKIQVFKNPDGSYKILETDDPDPNGRCNCMCVFDFGITVPDVEAGTLDVTFERHITDLSMNAKRTVWSGKITVPAMDANDSIDVDMEDASAWCMPESL